MKTRDALIAFVEAAQADSADQSFTITRNIGSGFENQLTFDQFTKGTVAVYDAATKYTQRWSVPEGVDKLLAAPEEQG